MSTQYPQICRRPDGSIDYDVYRAAATAERRAAVMQVMSACAGIVQRLVQRGAAVTPAHVAQAVH